MDPERATEDADSCIGMQDDAERAKETIAQLQAEIDLLQQRLAKKQDDIEALEAMINDLRGELMDAQANYLSETQKSGNLTLEVKAADRTIEDQTADLQRLRGELERAMQTLEETKELLSQEEQKCERRTTAYKAKTINLERCKEALAARKAELTEAMMELQRWELKWNRMSMASEDRDVFVAAGVPTSIGRPERPLLNAWEGLRKASMERDESSLMLPAVTGKPHTARGSSRRRARHSGEQVFSNYMLVPLRT